MKIGELFSRNISRPINGVVKADQQDDASVRQELEEFVVTKELTQHLDRFFSVYLDALDRPQDVDAVGKIGVWVSGFFGSGKSHLIKVLHYLFKNQTVKYDGTEKQAVDFFEDKIHDAMLLGNIKRAVSKNADVILFNIDSKADQSKGRNAILAVFLKVLNELQGYSPDHPHIAHMERYLDRQDKLGFFEKSYLSLTEQDWKDGRIDWQFHQDEIVKTLSETLGQSEASCHRWIDHAETDFSLTIENFSRWVKEYLDTKGSAHRLFFFVDEVGQFIGQDGHLMLNLQTIAEDLGVVCNGRAWVIVTSQEDIDTAIGSLSQARSNDFSKIQGRFSTRLSLSSTNTDEVIRERLLSKTDDVIDELKRLYEPKADILKNQLAFSQDTGMTLMAYQSADDFVKNYPFIPYQFRLLQKVFESIRRAGATGLHLSRGERSMLDAFQYAGQKAAPEDLGVLVPLYWFYPSIESFLDTAVKRTIEQAKEDPVLREFDVCVLQTLFMIRYIKEIKGNVDNLVTLCIDQVDSDRLALKERIEASLQRLEKPTLIARGGEDYFFLTNEEQEISREIKNVELEYGAESKRLGEIIIDDVYRGVKKHKYSKTNKDFDLNFLCDMQSIGGRPEKGLTVAIISPFFDDYEMYEQTRCLGESTNNNGQILMRLAENGKLKSEMRVYLQTDRYIARKNDGNPEVQRILRDRKEENRERNIRIVELAKEMLADSEYFIAGQKFPPDSDEPRTALTKSLDYLVDNTFPKMAYIEYPCTNPQSEIPSILRRDDMAQGLIDLNDAENNPRAVSEVRGHIMLCADQSTEMIVDNMLRDRYGNRPYGWNEWETALILSKLFIAGEINFAFNGGIVEKQKVSELILKFSNWKRLTVRRRKIADTAQIESIRNLGQALFSEMGPGKEDALVDFLRKRFQQWKDNLQKYQQLASTGHYPGSDVIEEGLRLCGIILDAKESSGFITRMIENRDGLSYFAEDYHEVDTFYSTQRPIWDRLREAKARFDINRFGLEKNEAASAALVRMKEILEAPAPYAIIKDAETLIQVVGNVNGELLSKEREDLCEYIDTLVDGFRKEAESRKCNAEITAASVQILENFKGKASQEHSIANIRYLREDAKSESDRLTTAIPAVGPAPRETVTVKPASFSKKTYLETEDDVGAFVNAVDQELRQAIKDGKRVRIE